MQWLNWAVFSISNKDVLLGWDSVVMAKDFKSINTNTIEYNQIEFKDQFWYCLCTAYAPMWVVSDNILIPLTEEQRKQIVKLRTSESDFNPKIWWLLNTWVDVVRRYLKSIWHNVNSYRINTKSNDFWELLDKWYRINIWINVKEWFYEDAQDNWVLDKFPIWAQEYWHSTSIKKIWDNYIVDNYKWVYKYNTFKLQDLKELIDKWIVFTWAYVLYNDKNLLINDLIMSFYKTIFNTENPTGSKVFNDLNGAVSKCIKADWTLDSEEFFYLNMIWLERIRKLIK